MKRLLASIHDVSPRFEGAVDALFDRLSGHLGGPRLAMLVIPDHWNSAPIAAGTPFATRLRDWADMGIEMFVHGWSHKDDMAHSDPRIALKAKHMTAGEGEFVGLDRAEAAFRLDFVDTGSQTRDCLGLHFGRIDGERLRLFRLRRRIRIARQGR